MAEKGSNRTKHKKSNEVNQNMPAWIGIPSDQGLLLVISLGIIHGILMLAYNYWKQLNHATRPTNH